MVYAQAKEYAHDGERLQALMDRAKIRAVEVADACDVSPQAVSKWLRTGGVAREHIPAICLLLSCQSDELLGIVPIRDFSNATEPYRPSYLSAKAIALAEQFDASDPDAQNALMAVSTVVLQRRHAV